MDYSNYQCDRCGACCRTLIVEVYYLDALREPQLLEVSDSTLPMLRDDGRRIMLYDPRTRACPFLEPWSEYPGAPTTCGIYETRPNCCVGVVAGDAKCQQSRRMAGLRLLTDIDGHPPTREFLEASCEEYDLEYDEWFVHPA